MNDKKRERMQLKLQELVKEHQQAEADLNQHVQNEMMRLANIAGQIKMLEGILALEDEPEEVPDEASA